MGEGGILMLSSEIKNGAETVHWLKKMQASCGSASKQEIKSNYLSLSVLLFSLVG
jgi:hypothetical protein